LLLLIDAFSQGPKGRKRFLEGRVKLAKLDFLLRYPRHLQRVLAFRNIEIDSELDLNALESPLEARMMRYRYGPWDPAYYAVLGALIGRGLIEVEALEGRSGYGYRTTTRGSELAISLRADESFEYVSNRISILRKHFDKSGNTLREYVYQIPEIRDAQWHREILWKCLTLEDRLEAILNTDWKFQKSI
jgi:hypothetical protein